MSFGWKVPKGCVGLVPVFHQSPVICPCHHHGHSFGCTGRYPFCTGINSQHSSKQAHGRSVVVTVVLVAVVVVTVVLVAVLVVEVVLVAVPVIV